MEYKDLIVAEETVRVARTLPTTAAGIVSNLLTPTVSRVANLIRKPQVKPLEVRVADQITMSDEVIMVLGLSLSFTVDTPSIVQSPAEERLKRA
jgi:hypothetical protein